MEYGEVSQTLSSGQNRNLTFVFFLVFNLYAQRFEKFQILIADLEFGIRA
jgi:hypothetical protein